MLLCVQWPCLTSLFITGFVSPHRLSYLVVVVVSVMIVWSTGAVSYHVCITRIRSPAQAGVRSLMPPKMLCVFFFFWLPRSGEKRSFPSVKCTFALAITPVVMPRAARCKLMGRTQPPSLRTPTRRDSSRRSKTCLPPASCHPLGNLKARVSAGPDDSAQSLACFCPSGWKEALRVGPKILSAWV
jgi:hypothetical protein